MKAKTFDRKFESGQDVSKDVDLETARRPLQQQRRVNVDFPEWMIQSLDSEATRLGVTRQSVIKVWVAERLEGRTADTVAAVRERSPEDRAKGKRASTR